MTNVLSHGVHVKPQPPKPKEYFAIRSVVHAQGPIFLYSMIVDDFQPLNLVMGSQGDIITASDDLRWFWR